MYMYIKISYQILWMIVYNTIGSAENASIYLQIVKERAIFLDTLPARIIYGTLYMYLVSVN